MANLARKCDTEGCEFLFGHEPPCENETIGHVINVHQAMATLHLDQDLVNEAMRHRRGHPSFTHNKNTNEFLIELPDGPVSEEWCRVVTEILPPALARYHAKSVDYSGTKRDLGPRGQFSDMWRKLKKLKKALWDGQQLVGEQPDEIIDDLIAHCLLIKLDIKDGVE